MKNTLFFLTIFIIVSCKSGVNFDVLNKSSKTIDSLIISNGYNKIKLKKIKKNKPKHTFLEFNKNSLKHDGNYSMEIYSEKLITKRRFGYFSNGIPSNSMFRIIIKNDTIILKEEF